MKPADKGELGRCGFWKKDVRLSISHLECSAVMSKLNTSNKERLEKQVHEMGPGIGFLLRLGLSKDD